jgi:hypothetical protein
MLRQVFKTLVKRKSSALLGRHLSSVSAKANFQNATVELYTKKAKHEFPFVWLRDNCKVSEIRRSAGSVLNHCHDFKVRRLLPQDVIESNYQLGDF